MKKIVSAIVLAAAICALSVIGAAAENKTKSLKFYTDVVVNGTRIEKGDYRVSFNESTNEVTIMKGKEALAKSSARLEKRDKKARSTQYLTADNGNGLALVSITFEGENDALVLGDGSAAGK